MVDSENYPMSSKPITNGELHIMLQNLTKTLEESKQRSDEFHEKVTNKLEKMDGNISESLLQHKLLSIEVSQIKKVVDEIEPSVRHYQKKREQIAGAMSLISISGVAILAGIGYLASFYMEHVQTNLKMQIVDQIKSEYYINK